MKFSLLLKAGATASLAASLAAGEQNHNAPLSTVSDTGQSRRKLGLQLQPGYIHQPCDPGSGSDPFPNDSSLLRAQVGDYQENCVLAESTTCTSANTYGYPINCWDVSALTDMSSVFSTSSFNQDIGAWDTSRVTSLERTFYFATQFNQDINTWDTSKVATMDGTFYLANTFNQPLECWDTSSVTDMQHTFSSATSFNQPLCGWDTSNVVNLQRTFYGSSFNQDINSWDVGKVTDAQNAFRGTTAFNQPLSSWDVASLRNAYGMFYRSVFNQPLCMWNVQAVTNFNNMFYGAWSFNQQLCPWRQPLFTYGTGATFSDMLEGTQCPYQVILLAFGNRICYDCNNNPPQCPSAQDPTCTTDEQGLCPGVLDDRGWAGCNTSPCPACAGDCDNDGECQEGLRCFERAALEAVPGCHGDGVYCFDYCVNPNVFEGVDPQALKSLGGSGCTPSFPCEACRGDCDTDADCEPGLFCFDRSGQEAVPGCHSGGLGDEPGYGYCAVATANPTALPTANPTALPTANPTALPTASPTANPTASPTALPTANPTSSPTAGPTASPTANPTTSPTASPTALPTSSPTSIPTSSPTASPTAGPTSGPTSSPTANPTSRPTPDPTSSPTDVPTAVIVGNTTALPWSIEFKSLDLDFTPNSTNNEVAISYDIAQGRISVTKLYSDGCSSDQASKSPLNVTGSDVITKSENKTESNTAGMETLKILYDFNKSQIAGADFWNNKTNSIELCQVVQLVYQTASGEDMVIQEDVRNVTIDFDLFANFSIDVDLAGAVIQAANDTTDLSGYITAYHCDGGDGMNGLQAGFKLRPNDVLNVCIVSSSTDVEINQVNTMTISGTAPGGAANQLSVLTNGAASIPAITSSRFVNRTSFVLSTRVPVNSFDYEAAGASIEVEGSLTMNLRDGYQSRKLLVDVKPNFRHLQAEAQEGEGTFELSVGLEPVPDTKENISLVTSDNKSVLGQGTLAIAGTIFTTLVLI